MASVVDERRFISPYRKLLNQLSDQLTRDDLDKLKLLCVDHIPRGKAEHIQSGLQFFDLLEQDSKIHQRDLALLEDMFNTIGRMDIVSTIRTFLGTLSSEENHHQKEKPSCEALADQPLQPFHGNGEVPDVAGDDPNNEPQDLATVSKTVKSPPLISANGVPSFTCDSADVVTDGGGDDLSGIEGGQRVKAVTEPAVQAAFLGRGPCLASFVNSNGQNGEASNHMRSMPARANTNEALEGAMARVGTCDTDCPEVQLDSYAAPPSMRYVDFMEFKGYAVQIIGGKHFMTPEGEFVEMNSGVQYKIRVINTHAEACNLDISIDGYDVGGWVLKGSEDMTIERPANEAKRFTFYRVKTAPKEAGIESGRSENGVIRCVFTPEAHVVVSVDVSSIRQTLQVDMPPSATVGDLKREIQRQLETDDDPDQVIVQDNRQLSNDFPLRRHRLPPAKNLRLLDAEMNISVEPSSGAKFLIKVHPGKARVRDVMQHIEEAIRVPVKDQKLHHGKSLLSDCPGNRLPVELICDTDPVLLVVIPEYLHITVKTQDGSTNTVNIDREKTLRDLLEEIPLGQTLAENEEAEFVFEGKHLNPYSDKRSLQSYNIRSESTLEVLVKTSFIVVKVCLSDCSRVVHVKMSPEATLRDLVTKLKKENKKGKLKGIKFAEGERILDPDQDKGPIQDYGVGHGSYLVTMSRNSKGVPPLSENKEKLRDLRSGGLRGETREQNLQYRDTVLGEEQEPMNQNIERRTLESMVERQGLQLDDMEARCKNSSSPAKKSKAFFGGGWSLPRFFGHSRPQMMSFEHVGASIRGNREEFVAQGQTLIPERRVTQKDPAWKSGGTTLQGNSRQMFAPAEPIKVDSSRKVELLLRLVAREDEEVGEVGMFPADECKPLSTLYPSAVPE